MLSACSFAPKYTRPLLPIPAHYKQSEARHSHQRTLQATTRQEPWWTLYRDDVLNQLETQVTCDNQNLKVALSRYQEALTIVETTRSALYPQILGIANAARQKNSVLNNSSQKPILLYNTFLTSLTFNYEVDAWGKIRNAIKTSDHLAKASHADLLAIGLSMHAMLANNYFQLRGADQAIAALDNTVRAYQKALDLTQHLHQGGAVAQFDVDEATILLERAKTLAQDMRLTRNQLENAIAVLIGQVPANFHISTRHLPRKIVSIAPDLPSTLLQRRPDIAAAEHRVMAANAQIGVAKAAFFPTFNLSGLLGFQRGELHNLFKRKSLAWSLGPPSTLIIAQPEVTQIIFDGFYLQAQLAHANAEYREIISAYRQTVLTAFEEVEDALISLVDLEREIQSQNRAYHAAKRACQQISNQYRGGIATFLDVVVPEIQTLQAQLNLIEIQTRRQVASVTLIKALGGGWENHATAPQKTARKNSQLST